MLQDRPLTVRDLRGMRERLAKALDAVQYPQGTEREWFSACLASIYRPVQGLPDNTTLPYSTVEQLTRLISFLESHNIALE